MSLSSFSLSSTLSVADADLAAEVAEVPPSEELPPGAVVSSERLPPLMMMSPLSTSPLLLSLLSACLT